MSGYYFYSLHFVMRADQEPAYRVLSSVATGITPDEAALAEIHPVPRHFLEEPSRFLDDENEPRIGAPIRLARDRVSNQPRLSIELCLHDDSFADGGYMFWLWLMSLVQPPPTPWREVIGYDGIYRNDADMGFTVATAEAITNRHNIRVPCEEIQQQLADWTSWETWLSRRRGG